MALEPVPAGQVPDGYGRVWFVATIAGTDGPTVAEINAGTSKELTYSLVADGWRHETTENVVTVDRYTLRDILENPGTIQDTLELQYASGTTADTNLVEGTTGFLVHRLGIANATAPAAAQKVDVIPIKCGVQRKVAPTRNTELAKVQKMFVTGPVRRDVAIVA